MDKTEKKRPEDSKSQNARDDLIIEHDQYLKKIVNKLIRVINIPAHLHDEVWGAAYLGLVEAAQSYDTDKSEFTTYAYLKVRGAIIDCLRNSSGLGGKAANYVRALQAAHELREDLCFNKEETLAVNEKLKSKYKISRALDYISKGALAYKLSMGDVETEVQNKTDGGPSPEEQSNHIREIKVLKNLIENLPKNECMVLTQYYFENKSFAEIARDNDNYTRSWISRLHLKGVERIKKSYLEHRRKESSYWGKHDEVTDIER
jgi:RNA polymerase sigma factor for flagellar operon FliA